MAADLAGTGGGADAEVEEGLEEEEEEVIEREVIAP